MNPFHEQRAYHEVFFRHCVPEDADRSFIYRGQDYSFFHLPNLVWRIASSPSNDYLCMRNVYPLLANARTAGLFLSHLVARFETYDAIRIDPFPLESTAFRNCKTALAGLDIPYLTHPSVTMPTVTVGPLLPGSPSFQQKIKRKERRLRQATDCSLRLLAAPSEDELIAVFNLEAKGWKGRSGTALTLDPIAHGLFLDLAQTAADRNELRLFTLTSASGSVLAFHFCIQSGKTLSLVKTSYDETYKKYSPGMVLTWLVLTWMREQNLATLDFNGPIMDWHREFGPSLEPSVTLFIGTHTLRSRLYLGYRSLKHFLRKRKTSKK